MSKIYYKSKKYEIAKERKREIALRFNEMMELNRRSGRVGEIEFLRRMKANDYQCARTGRGSDYKCRKIDYWTEQPKGRWEFYEIKTGNAKLSPLQRKMKAKYGSRYHVVYQKLPYIY
jgi:hypothetical protein